MNILRHKKALDEIFTAEMTVGGDLENICDAVNKSSIAVFPDTAYNLIVLGDFNVADIPTGDLKDKYLIVAQEIVCVAVLKNETNNDVEAEYRAHTLARKVKTILKNNRKLVSSSYSDGVAKESHVSDSPMEHVVFNESQCCIVTVSLMFKMKEED